MLFQRAPGTARLRLEARNEADVDDGAPGADHPVMINVSQAALCSGDIDVPLMLFPGGSRRGSWPIRGADGVHEANEANGKGRSRRLTLRAIRRPTDDGTGVGDDGGPTAKMTSARRRRCHASLRSFLRPALEPCPPRAGAVPATRWSRARHALEPCPPGPRQPCPGAGFRCGRRPGRGRRGRPPRGRNARTEFGGARACASPRDDAWRTQAGCHPAGQNVRPPRYLRTDIEDDWTSERI